VSLWGRRADALEAAKESLPGCLLTTNLADAIHLADVVVLCTPVAAMDDLVVELATSLPTTTPITDAGSIKSSVVAKLEARWGGHFVGSHPVAGSEQSGFAHAREDLFDRALCILTPTETSDPAALETIRALWLSAGCRLHEMSPADHDLCMARVSHLPHAAAAALVHAARVRGAAWKDFAGSGYRDSTRVAGGPPAMWADILLENRAEILAGLKDLQSALGQLEVALAEGNRSEVESFLATARNERLALSHPK